jgi:hypothetical protein
MPIQAAANRLKREITQGKTNSNQPSAEELKKKPQDEQARSYAI